MLILRKLASGLVLLAALAARRRVPAGLSVNPDIPGRKTPSVTMAPVAAGYGDPGTFEPGESALSRGLGLSREFQPAQI